MAATGLENHNQIESKLTKERNNLAKLKERVDRYHDLSNSMTKILTTFEDRLGKLEKTILPVYNKTEHLQKRQQNLDTTLQCLENVLSHYDASQEVCNLIHLGPSEGNILNFLNALDKLKGAKDYFLNNNPQSVELENVTSLFNNGCDTLNNHFKLLLTKHSTPMKPVDLLDLIYIEDDSSNEDCPSIKQLSPTTREELHVIASWLNSNLRLEYIDIYASGRSDVVYKSLQLLKDHQKSGSWGNEPTKTRYYGRNEPRKSTSARLQQIFERKANKMLMKASQTLENSTGLSLKKASASETLSPNEYQNENGDQELEKYLVLLLGLQRLLLWERHLLVEIIPSSRHSEVFSKLAFTSIEMIVRDVESITNRVLKNISRREWSSALSVFSALKHVILLQPDLDKACDQNQRQQLILVLNKLKQTGAKALEQFIELVRSDSNNIVGMSSTLSTVPRDATVHELTSNAIWFVEHLFEHFDVIGNILLQDVQYAKQLNHIAQHKLTTTEDRNRAVLGIYIKKVLSELNLNLVSKCDQYNDPATKYLFRLNNMHYILKSLQQSSLLDLVQLMEPTCEREYQEVIQDLKNNYQKTWIKMISHVAPLDELPRPINGKVKEKERQILKERFSNFNKDLDEIYKTQRAISVPDVILREGLKRDSVENVIPSYNAFFELYSDVQFSKNPEKYVKYRPEDVSAMLNNFFDDSISY